MCRALGLILVVPLVGCGRIGFDGFTGGGDDNPSGDDEPLSDGGSGDDAADGPSTQPSFGQCVTGSTLVDNFDDGTAAPAFTANSLPTIGASEANNQMTVTYGANVPTGAIAYYLSGNYATDGLCIELEVSQIPLDFGSMIFYLDGPVVQAGFITSGESISTVVDAGLGIGQTGVGFGILPTHRYWRIDVRNQDVRFWTSSDAITWNLRGTQIDVFTDTSAQVMIGAGAINAPVTNGGSAIFERVAIGHD